MRQAATLGSARQRAMLAAALAAVLAASQTQAQPCTQLPAQRAVPDGGSGCLAIEPVEAARGGAVAPTGVLVVMLHGDRGGTLEERHLERWREVGRALQAHGHKAVFMVRPGYRTPAGDSSGWANPRDDDYTSGNVARIAGALAHLRQAVQPRHVVLVGHSGGAAMAALVLGRHPGAADAALLLGCPCEVPAWRDHRNMQRAGADRPWTHSLSPLAFVAGIPPGTPVIAATGAQDDNTLPRFAQRWVQAAVARGVRASFEELPGHDHGSILRWESLPARLQALVAALPQ